MMYIDGNWMIGFRMVKYAETVLHKGCFENTEGYNLDIEPVDEDLFKFTGSIEDLLLFIYNEVLKYKNYTLDDIIKDPKELNENAEIYLKKEW